MPPTKITAAQFAQIIGQGITLRDATQDVTIGPIRDIVIRPNAKVFEQQNDRVRGLFQLLCQQNVNNLVPADEDAFVFNEQVLRSQGTPGQVQLVFARSSAPTSDCTVPANFPVGTNFDSSTNTQITFVTLTEATMIAANAAAYYNPSTSRYELVVNASSITSGPQARVGPGSVTLPLRPLLNFDSVSNPNVSTGGLPPETNQDVSNRYFLRIQGTEIGTPAGLARYAEQLFGSIQDCYVVYGNDPFLTRSATDAGSVDVWIKGSSPIQKTVTLLYPGPLVLLPFDTQPGVQVISVTAGATYVLGQDYVYVPDAGIYSGSTRGQDGIVFLPTGAQPSIGTPVQITYQYDNLILALQQMFSQQPEYTETGRDALWRRGIAVQIALQGVLTVNSGDPNTVLATVTQALLDTINGSTTVPGYTLGQSVEEFDLDEILAAIPGVGNFVYNLLAPVGGSGVADIPIGKNQYASLLSSNLAVTLG